MSLSLYLTCSTSSSLDIFLSSFLNLTFQGNPSSYPLTGQGNSETRQQMQLFSMGLVRRCFYASMFIMCLSSLGFPPGFTVSVPLRSSIDLSTYTLIKAGSKGSNSRGLRQSSGHTEKLIIFFFFFTDTIKQHVTLESVVIDRWVY